MEKTLEIKLAEQRDAILEAIANSHTPEDVQSTQQLIWEKARIHFTKIVYEAADANV